MDKQDIQELRNVLKLLETGTWEVSMQQQMLNVQALNKFSQTIVKLEKELEGIKPVENKNTVTPLKKGK